MQISKSSRPVSILAMLAILIVQTLWPQPVALAAPDSPDAIPTTLLTDSKRIGGFELYGNGIFWHHTDGFSCTPEFPQFARVAVKPVLSSAGFTRLVDESCESLSGFSANAVRDSQYAYYMRNQRLVRKALNASVNDAPTILTQSPTIAGEAPAIAIDAGGYLYWSARSGGQLKLWRMLADNSAAPQELTQITLASGLATQIVPYRYCVFSGGFPQTHTGVAFVAANGALWRFQQSDSSVLLLAGNVRTIHAHRSGGIALCPSVAFYAASTPIAGADTVRRVTTSGVETTLFSAQTADSEITSVTTDAQNAYVSEQAFSTGGFPVAIGTSIRRRALSAASNAPWDLIVTDVGGGNLRSDGQTLYFIDNGADSAPANRIRKVSTDAEPVQIDIEAIDLEVTQAIQDMKESMPLVAGHPTVVRGYARLSVGTEAEAYNIGATLTGKLNGVPLPGGPLSPFESVVVDKTTSKASMRATVEKSFLFELPEAWVKHQQPNVLDLLTLELNVNPSADPPETVGAQPYANNKLIANAFVRNSRRPCLMMIPVRADHQPVLGRNPPGLAEKIARARSLMPVKNFKVFTNYSSTDLEDNWILSDGGDDYDMNNSTPSDTEDDDDDGALGDLDDLDAWSDAWQGCSSLHWVGMLHPDTPVWFGGIASRDDNVLLSKMSDGAGRIIAHELAHNFGRKHIECGSFPDGQDNFDELPYNPCHLYFTNLPLEDTFFGFDTIDKTPIDPKDRADLMSYSSPKWPSHAFWLQLMSDIPNFDGGELLATSQSSNAPRSASITAASAASAAQLYVSGQINFDAHTGAFNTVYQLPDGVAPPAKAALSHWQQARAVGATSDSNNRDHTLSAAHSGIALIRQLDAADAVLSETPAITKEMGIHLGGQHRYNFSQYTPLNAQTRKVQLVHGGQVVAERRASTQPPALTLTAPVMDTAAQTIALSWQANDADGDSLEAMVLYSNDNGAHWLPMDKNITTYGVKYSLLGLAAGTQARLRVILSDGFHATVATSDAFVVAKHAPAPVIDGVIQQQRLPYTATTQLFGMALDADEGSLDADAMSWQLTGPTPANFVGSQITLAGLAPGAYTLTLTATDADGMTGSAARQFEVLPIPVTDATTPQLDGSCSDASYAQASALPLDGDTEARMLHASGALYVCFSRMTFAPGAATHLAGLRIDADNSRDPFAQSSDRGFFVDEDGFPSQTVGNGATMPVTTAPAPGFSAFVQHLADDRWSAELRIEESLVGGWNHAAGIMLHHDALTHDDEAADWPAGADYRKPASWTAAQFGGGAGVLPNRPPVANAGADQQRSLSKQTVIALDAIGSYDPDLDPISFQWTQVAGPSVTLGEPTTTTIRFTANPVGAPTELRFQLIASDGAVNSAADEVAVQLLPAAASMTQVNKVFLPLARK